MERGASDQKLAVIAVVVGLAGIGAYLLRHGVAVDTDAVTYLSAAENLFHGRGLRSFNGAPVVVWPPLYSLILAGLMFFTGGDVLTAAAVSDVLAYLLAAWTGWKLFSLYVKEDRVRMWAFVVYVLGQPFWERFVEAKSEPWFIVWVNLFLWQAAAWVQSQRPRHLWALALAGALAVMQRYVGVTLWAAWAVMLLFRSSLPGGRRWKVLVMPALPAMLTLVGWLFFSWHWTGTLGGMRAPPFYGVGKWLWAFYHTVCSWVIPSAVRWGLTGQVVVVMLGTLVMGALKASCRTHLMVLMRRHALLMAWVVLYLLMLLISGTTMWISLPGSRLLAPMFGVWLIGMAGLAGCVLQKKGSFARYWRYGLLLLVGLHLGRSGYSMVQAYRKGLHYSGMQHRLLNRWLAHYEGPHAVLTTHPERFWYAFPAKRPRPYSQAATAEAVMETDTVFILWEAPPWWVKPPSLRWAFVQDRPLLERKYQIERVDSSAEEAVYRLVRATDE